MKPIKPEEQDRLLALLRKSKKRLNGFDGVHKVDVGYAFKRGKPTNRLAIRVHVHSKRPEAELARSQILPKEIDGVPVDVLETNPELHLVNRTVKQNPLLAGVEIGNTSLPGVGTLGAIVFDDDTLSPMGLSNNHVLFGATGAAGNDVNQPGTTVAADRVGTVMRANQFYDCAVFRLDPTKRPFTLSVADLPAPPSIAQTATVLIGMKVVKSGRTTAVTYGIVDGVDSVEFTVVPDPAKTPAGTQVSMPGDSGSVWLEDPSHRAVGLHYAGETSGPDRAWAKRIGGVLDKLQVHFLDTIALSRIYIGWYAHAIGLTSPNASCNLKITYPSGRISGAKGLGAKTADANGFVRWDWTVGTSTDPKGGIPGIAEFTLDGQSHVAHFYPKHPPPP
jgi:hypothetical protein